MRLLKIAIFLFFSWLPVDGQNSRIRNVKLKAPAYRRDYRARAITRAWRAEKNPVQVGRGFSLSLVLRNVLQSVLYRHGARDGNGARLWRVSWFGNRNV